MSADERLTEDEFADICVAEKNDTKKYKGIRERLGDVFEKVNGIVKNLVKDCNFSFDEFKRKYYNLRDPNEVTLYSLWRDVAGNKSAGTKASYTDALKRFTKDMGGKVKFEDVGRTLVTGWQDKMIKEGLSKTTVNIYLRAFRVVVNEAASQDLIKTDTKALFKKISIGGRNSYNSRKHEYLTVEQWRNLWRLYETKGEGNEVVENWQMDKKLNMRERNMNALGMMLFMYLADGMNLRDVINLRYDDFYFSHNREQFRFVRQKVAKRTDAEVVFPVLPQMRVILGRQALPEERGGLVFGYLLGKAGKIDDEEERRLCLQFNAVIRDRMRSVAKAVQAMTGCDIFEVKTVKPYPAEYKPCTEVVKHELEKNIIREVQPIDIDLSKYDVIALATPTWWHHTAMPLQTWAKAQDFTGKLVITCNTHEGGGLMHTREDFEKVLKHTGAKLGTHLTVYGSVSKNSKEVRKWLLVNNVHVN